MSETSMTNNRFARISFYSAILTLISFCIGLAPFLIGSSIICYPAAFLFGTVALVSGGIALIQIRYSGEPGRWMAVTGIILGGLTVIATVCAIMLTLWLGAAFVTQLILNTTPIITPTLTPTIIPISTP